MRPTPERLAAYADGELGPAAAGAVEAELARSPELRAEVEAHRALRAKLAAHFAPIAGQPVPARLIDAVCNSGAEVVDLQQVRGERNAARRLPRWTWLAAPALAASIALAVFLPHLAGGEYAEGALATALERQLVASQRADLPVRVVLSFREGAGRFCRAYVEAAHGGIACRDGAGWRIVRRFASRDESAATEYRQAGAHPALMAAVQQMAAGPALDATGELRAKARRWRPE